MKVIIISAFLVLMLLILFGCSQPTKKEVYYETFVKENIGSETDCLVVAKNEVMDVCKVNLSKYLDCNAYWNATEVSYTEATKQCYIKILLSRTVKK